MNAYASYRAAASGGDLKPAVRAACGTEIFKKLRALIKIAQGCPFASGLQQLQPTLASECAVAGCTMQPRNASWLSPKVESDLLHCSSSTTAVASEHKAFPSASSGVRTLELLALKVRQVEQDPMLCTPPPVLTSCTPCQIFGPSTRLPHCRSRTCSIVSAASTKLKVLQTHGAKSVQGTSRKRNEDRFDVQASLNLYLAE